MRALIGAAALLLTACAQSPLPGPAWQQVHPAVSYRQFAPLPDSVVHALRIDLQAPGVRVQLSAPAERGRPLDQMAGSAVAVASVNASFFNKDFQPRGLTLSQGEAWAPVMAPQTSPVLACDAQSRCQIQLHPPFALLSEWFNVVAGTPWLLDQGRVRTPADDAGCASLCAQSHPRTAVGLDASGRYLFLVVSEGRRPPVLGLNLAQLSAVMLQLGAHHAFNLDGGGSSTMLLQGRSMLARPFNEPQLRRISNGLQIHLDARPDPASGGG